MPLSFDKPLLMGILNLTPDSFSDGGKHTSSPHTAFQSLIQQGADIIDIGAESTFGAEAQVSAEEEWNRLEPLLIELDLEASCVSVDTWKADVAHKALSLGVQMINDVTALRGDDEMLEVLMEHQPYVCLMFSADQTPYASRTNYQYQDVMKTVKGFLLKQAQLLIARGFPPHKIILDPGLGFFISSDPHFSWEIIDRLEELKELGFPILVGPSLKSFLGGKVESRLQESLGAAEMCLDHGANIVRVHHVSEHRELFDLVVS